MGLVSHHVPVSAPNLRPLNKIRAGLAGLLAVLAVACGSGTAPFVPTPPTQPTPPPRPMVVIVSIDGLRPGSLSVERTPNILDMAGRGTACWQAQTIFPPITLPSHASMLTGYLPATHGLTWGDYQCRPSSPTRALPACAPSWWWARTS